MFNKEIKASQAAILNPKVLNEDSYTLMDHQEIKKQNSGDCLKWTLQRFLIKLPCQLVSGNLMREKLEKLLNLYNGDTEEIETKGILVAHYQEKCGHKSTVAFFHVTGTLKFSDKALLVNAFGNFFLISGAKGLNVADIYCKMIYGDPIPYWYGFPEEIQIKLNTRKIDAKISKEIEKEKNIKKKNEYNHYIGIELKIGDESIFTLFTWLQTTLSAITSGKRIEPNSMKHLYISSPLALGLDKLIAQIKKFIYTCELKTPKSIYNFYDPDADLIIADSFEFLQTGSTINLEALINGDGNFTVEKGNKKLFQKKPQFIIVKSEETYIQLWDRLKTKYPSGTNIDYIFHKFIAVEINTRFEFNFPHLKEERGKVLNYDFKESEICFSKEFMTLEEAENENNEIKDKKDKRAKKIKSVRSMEEKKIEEDEECMEATSKGLPIKHSRDIKGKTSEGLASKRIKTEELSAEINIEDDGEV